MSDFEQRIREFEKKRSDEEKMMEDDFKSSVAPLLPLAILFCNEQGHKLANVDQVQKIFDGRSAIKYQALEESIQGLELVSYLASYLSDKTGNHIGEMLLITNANERGFDAIRLMNYFEPCFYVATLDHAKFLEKLGFFLEEKTYLDDYARQTYDKIWEIYDHLRSEYISAGLTPELVSNSYVALDQIRYANDALHIYLEKIIEQLERK